MCTYNVGAIGPFYLHIIRHFDKRNCLFIYLLSPVGTTIKDNHSRLHESLITNVSFTVTLWDLSSNGQKITPPPPPKSSVQSKTNKFKTKKAYKTTAHLNQSSPTSMATKSFSQRKEKNSFNLTWLKKASTEQYLSSMPTSHFFFSMFIFSIGYPIINFI
jgi:hypothetical protein